MHITKIPSIVSQVVLGKGAMYAYPTPNLARLRGFGRSSTQENHCYEQVWRNARFKSYDENMKKEVLTTKTVKITKVKETVRANYKLLIREHIWKELVPTAFQRDQVLNYE